jgi:hypothetical protein
MPPPLFTRTSTISATKVPIDLEAVNLLLIGENDTVMPLTDPPKTKRKIYFTSTISPIAWFNNTYGKWFKYGANFSPCNIEELFQELISTHPTVMYQFINQWKSQNMTYALWIETFNDDAGSTRPIGIPSSGISPFASHWDLLKNEFIYNECNK